MSERWRATFYLSHGVRLEQVMTRAQTERLLELLDDSGTETVVLRNAQNPLERVEFRKGALDAYRTELESTQASKQEREPDETDPASPV